jgi:hypothetical protein
VQLQFDPLRGRRCASREIWVHSVGLKIRSAGSTSQRFPF